MGQVTKSAHSQVKRYALSFVNLPSQELTRVLPEWFSRTHKWCLGVCEMVASADISLLLTSHFLTHLCCYGAHVNMGDRTLCTKWTV